MKALAVFCVLLGVIGMLAWSFRSVESQDQARAVAVNYAVYRNEVFLYATRNPAATGEVSIAALRLPEYWRPLHSWRNRAEAGRCYVYGPASAEEIAAIRSLFLGSFSVGRKESGALVPSHGAAMPLPAFIPEGDVVSVIEVR